MLPRSLTVLGVKIAIRQTDKLPMGDNENAEVLGVAEVLDDRIYIHKDMSELGKRKILAHEIFHHALFKNGVSQSITPQIEEVLCQSFATLYFELKKQGL